MFDEEAIFQIARKLDQPDRDQYMDQVCAGDQALRERVEAMHAAYEHDDSEVLVSRTSPHSK